MQISSNGGLYYGQLGLQRSQQSLDQASTKVAEASTGRTSDGAREAIQSGLIDAKTSEINAKANARVIDTSNEMLGTLIDIKA